MYAPLRNLPWLLLLAFIELASLTACTPQGLVRQRADFATHLGAIKRITLLPPDVQMELVHLGGQREKLHEHQSLIADDLTQATREALFDRGFMGLQLSSGSTSPTPDSERLFRDAKIARLYARLNVEVALKPGQPLLNRNLEYTLGAEARELAELARSDGLVFIHFSGWKRTGGSVATEMAVKVLLTAGYAPQDPIGAGELEVSFVDGRTGDILWTNRVDRGKFGFDPPDFERQELQGMTRDLFKAFPKRSGWR